METERLYRHSIPGIVFLGSLALFYLAFGGAFWPIESVFTDSKISLLIAVIVTAPALGILISTFTQTLIHIWGYKFYINKPKPIIYNKVLKYNDDLRKVLSTEKIDSESYKLFYRKYQAYIRMNLKEESIKFLQRRWNFFWIHANNMMSIILAFILSLCLDKSSPQNNIKESVLISLIVFVVLYFFASFYHARIIWKDVIEIEEESVLRFLKE